MAAVKAGTWRRVWLNVHLWIGAGLLVALAPLGLSGAALVWDVRLDRMMSSSHYVAPGDEPRLGASAYLAGGQAAFGDRARANQVRYPYNPGDPVVVSGRLSGASAPGGIRRSLNAWLDPASGKLLDVGDPRATPIGTIHRLHGNLLLPANGRPVVGWLGVAMTVSSLTGLWLWWPRGAFAAGFGWRRGPHVFSNLHHLGGFWICAPLFVLSVSGVYIAFPKASHALAGAPPPTARPFAGAMRDIAGPTAPARMTPDQAAAAVLQARPGARLVTVQTPEAGRHLVWRVQVAGAGTNPVSLSVDDATGAVREDRPGPAQNLADPLSQQIREIHTGDETPLAWKFVITAAGLAPTLLGATGLVIWLRRPRRPSLPKVAS